MPQAAYNRAPAEATYRDLVPDRGHYDAVSYYDRRRLFSSAHQVDAVRSTGARTVLEVGPGGGLVTVMLRALGLEVTTLDLEATTAPQVLGDVSALPFADDAFDAVLCSQVLEHLPFDRFVPTLRGMRRVARRAAVISLPDMRHQVGLGLVAPRVGRRETSWSLGWPRRGRFPARLLRKHGHHWEIGWRETPFARVRDAVAQAGWRLRDHWRVPEFRYHSFLVLERPDAAA